MNLKEQTRRKTKEAPTFRDSYGRLRMELQTGSAAPTPPTTLQPGEYHFATGVFQPRGFEGNIDSSEEHVDELYEAALRGDTLPPLTIWWGGRKWYVVDGHHRAQAVNRVQLDWKQGKLKTGVKPAVLDGVAVEVFTGSLNDAVAMAASLNSKNKLPMTKKDKLERAWKLVALEDPTLSKSVIATMTGVAERTVATMRATLAEWVRRQREMSFDEPQPGDAADTTWEQMKGGGRPSSKDERWEEAQAEKMARTLGRVFGGMPGKLPHVFARAIELYSPNLAGHLKEHWGEERAQELVYALAEDMGLTVPAEQA